MMFARVLGRTVTDVQAETVVMAIKPLNVNQDVAGKSNPFLSGMPKDSIGSHINPHNNPDYAGDSSNPKQSPTAIGMGIQEGTILNFDSITGTVQHDPEALTTPRPMAS